MSITIRPATSDDIPELQKLITESVSLLSANYYTSKQIESRPASRLWRGHSTHYLARGYQKGEEIPIDTPDGESLATFRMTREF